MTSLKLFQLNRSTTVHLKCIFTSVSSSYVGRIGWVTCLPSKHFHQQTFLPHSNCLRLHFSISILLTLDGWDEAPTCFWKTIQFSRPEPTRQFSCSKSSTFHSKSSQATPLSVSGQRKTSPPSSKLNSYPVDAVTGELQTTCSDAILTETLVTWANSTHVHMQQKWKSLRITKNYHIMQINNNYYQSQDLNL